MFGQQIFRLDPQGQPEDYRTFQIVTPQTEEFWEPATCEEVGCEQFLNGWDTRLPVGSDLVDVVRSSNRPYTQRLEDGVVVFTFAPGLPCFRAATHRLRLERPSLFVVKDGDWRGNPTGQSRQHARPEDWVEDFKESVQDSAELKERG